MARIDFNAAEFDGLGFENRHDPNEPGLMALAQLVKRRPGSLWFWTMLRRIPGAPGPASPIRLARPIVALRE
jgi:hypothetical protein